MAKDMQPAELSMGCFRSFCTYVVGGALIAFALSLAHGFDVWQFVEVTLSVGLFGAYWRLSRILGSGDAPAFSLKWLVSWGGFLLWLAGLAHGTWLVVPAGPGEYEIVGVLWVSFHWLAWPGGLFALALEWADTKGYYQVKIEAPRPQA